MLIECHNKAVLARGQPIIVPHGNETYAFRRDAQGRMVCEVHVPAHIECFLAVSSIYREAGTEPEFVLPPGPGIIDIKGIGTRLVQILKGLGVDPGETGLRQIAAWTAADVAAVETKLAFPGRIARERWVEQARDLIAGADKAD